MKITFFGAAQGVTGSCHMVEAAGKKFLVDCGMFQGTLQEQLLNYEDFPFNINEIDFVILSHAHIDHTGRIPKLYKEGYSNSIYGTKATCDLAGIMLPDSGHIQEREIEWVNRKRLRSGKKPTEPLYTAQDAIDCLKLFEVVNYHEEFQINENLHFKFLDAGHMLGSSIVEIYIKEDGKQEKLVFTGDLGNQNMPILKNPEVETSADVLVTESTYGARKHGDIEDQSSEFLSIILTTIARGGNVIIPSFAVGRTQEMLYEINKNKEKYGDKVKQLDEIPVYVDSPLAVNATEIFKQNPECFDKETLEFIMSGSNPLDFKNLHFVKTAEESKALNEDRTPKIIISASGMCEVGRIKHHLKHNLWRPECTVLFVGYQAEGTLGRRILNGEKLVKIYGEEIGINAEIRYLDSFSGHADEDGLLKFIEDIKEKPQSIFIVHGEPEGQKVFKKDIKEKFNINATIPSRNETYEIKNGEVTFVDTSKQYEYKSKRFEVLQILSYLKEDIDDLTNIVKKEIKQNVDEIELINLKDRLDEIKKLISITKGEKSE